MITDGSNLSKSRFDRDFRRSLVNFKNLILFWSIGLFMVCKKVEEFGD